MSADVLQRAANLMRVRAQKVEPGRYGFISKWTTPNTMLTRVTRNGAVVAEMRDKGESLYDLNHLSHWHADVALAVADLLDAWVLHDLLASSGSLADEKAAVLRVARTYLNEVTP